MTYQQRTGEAFGLRQSSGALAAGVNWTTDEILPSASSHSVGKAVEDYRSPRRFATIRALGSAPAFGLRQPSGAFGSGRELDDGRNFALSLITFRWKSGRGLPQSKTLRDHQGRWEVRQLLDCASPLALFGEGARGPNSGRGLPHSKTLARDFKPQRHSISPGMRDERIYSETVA